MDYRKKLDDAKLANVPVETMARKVYLSFPTHAFSADHDLEFELLDKIANFFDVPFSGVQVLGSAKTGFSLVKDTPFDSTTSDLDIALIDQQLFAKYWEIAFRRSDAFQVTAFQSLGINEAVAKQRRRRFLQLLQKGIISPDSFPYGPERAELEVQFKMLSKGYATYFSRISAYIYASEKFFAHKQVDAINHYWYR